MATLEQLEAALRAADAAGNVEDARRLAQAYAAARSQKADFSSVQGGSDTVARRQPAAINMAGLAPGERAAIQSGRAQEVSPLLSGMTAPIRSLGRGGYQLFAKAADAINPREQTLSGLIAGQQPSRYQEAQEAEAFARQGEEAAGTYSPMGTLGQMTTYGLLGAGPVASVGQRFGLPGIIAASGATGAAYGAAAPTVEGESRALNAGLGGLLGTAGAGIPAAALKAAPWLGRFVPAIRKGQQERVAANVLRESANDPNAIAAVGQPLVPGSSPSLAEATGDIGLGQLQRILANESPEFASQLAAQQAASNTARVRAIEGALGGADDEAAAAIRQAASARAGRMLRPVRETPIQPESLLGLDRTLSSLIEKNRAHKNVREALEFVRSEIGNVHTVGDAHGFRQTIGELIGGNIEGKAGGKLAQSELMTVRSLLDREMRKAYPEWGDFLKGHRSAMRQADQAGIGADLLATGRAVRTATNEPILTPAAFSRAVQRIERPKTKGARLRSRALTDEQMGTIQSVRQDLERQARAQGAALATGSNTRQNFAGAERLQGLLGGRTLKQDLGTLGITAADPVSGLTLAGVNALRGRFSRQTLSIVQDVMANPQEAQKLLSRYPENERRLVIEALRQLPAAGGLLGAASAPVL